MISDVICPWCLIGKRRLEKAIAVLEAQNDVRVKWLPFQLNPEMPREGIPRKEYRIKKFGSWDRSQELDAKLVAVGETEGVHFAFDRIERTPNTEDAHRLIALAEVQGCQDVVMEALFIAYFTEGQDISDRRTLIDIVVKAGLDRSRAEETLNRGGDSDEFKIAEERSRHYRVDGVPFFIINDEITLAGAQSTETFVKAFQMAVASC